MFPVSPKVNPRFGFAPDNMLKTFDFVSLGNSTVPQNKLNYAICISSRIIKARTNNERMEVVRRDPFGWFFWFYGNPLMQTAIMLFAVRGAVQKMLLSKIPKPANAFHRLLWQLDPTQRIRIASDHQVRQRMAQVIKAMKAKGEEHLIPAVRKRFQKAINMRALSSFTGLMFTFLALGIGINLYNIYVTRKNVQKQKAAKAAMMKHPMMAYQQPMHFARFGTMKPDPIQAPQWHPPMR